jgi:hypothetical protein
MGWAKIFKTMDLKMRKIICHLSISVLFYVLILSGFHGNCRASDQNEAIYVGTESCRGCHEVEYDNFKAFAKKATSYASIKKMQKGLTAEELKECYGCHTTGYGKPGGFVSIEKTPHLQDAGCEVCHGPGSKHVESEDPDDLMADLDADSCKACHNSTRVEAFNFKPMLYGGAH